MTAEFEAQLTSRPDGSAEVVRVSDGQTIAEVRTGERLPEALARSGWIRWGKYRDPERGADYKLLLFPLGSTARKDPV